MRGVHALRDGLPGPLHRHRGSNGTRSWPDREKYPENFVIDELRCIYCGMCEEACPVEAIELTGLYDLSGLTREQMIFDKTKLLSVFDATKDQEPMPLAARPSAGIRRTRRSWRSWQRAAGSSRKE